MVNIPAEDCRTGVPGPYGSLTIGFGLASDWLRIGRRGEKRLDAGGIRGSSRQLCAQQGSGAGLQACEAQRPGRLGSLQGQLAATLQIAAAPPGAQHSRQVLTGSPGIHHRPRTLALAQGSLEGGIGITACVLAPSQRMSIERNPAAGKPQCVKDVPGLL